MLNRIPSAMFLGMLFSFLFTGCFSGITNYPLDDVTKADKGVPWVEPREYDMYVYVGNGNPTPDQIYYGRHFFLDQVSGQQIDSARPKWQTNYKAWMLSDATFTLDLDENGALKKALVTSESSAPGVAAVGKSTAETIANAKKGKLARKDTELKLLQNEKAIKDIREELEK